MIAAVAAEHPMYAAAHLLCLKAAAHPVMTKDRDALLGLMGVGANTNAPIIL